MQLIRKKPIEWPPARFIIAAFAMAIVLFVAYHELAKRFPQRFELEAMARKNIDEGDRAIATLAHARRSTGQYPQSLEKAMPKVHGNGHWSYEPRDHGQQFLLAFSGDGVHWSVAYNSEYPGWSIDDK